MSPSDVTRDGIEGERPGREATTGLASGDTQQEPGRFRRRGRGEQPMVPDAEFASYYGQPVINSPVWKAKEIGGYLFLGGLAGGASLLAAGAEATRRPTLARASKAGAFGAISLSLVALVADLGKPMRFINMLRVFRPTSPMNLGSWLLTAYGPAAGAAAVTDLTHRLPRTGQAATGAAALLAPAVASYTAVLVSDTAVPAWHDGYPEMPFVFAGSGAYAAGGLGMIAAPTRESGPARRLALVGGLVELAATERMKHRLGMVAEPYSKGKPGVMMKVGQALTVAGLAGGLTAGRRSRAVSAVAGAALVTGSALTKLGVFQAGIQSANDPKYTVVPQRRRLDAGQPAGQ